MKKKIQRPFSIEEWKNGAKVETIDEEKVRILCTDVKNSQPIIAVVTSKNGEEYVRTFDAYGHYYTGEQSCCDLVIVEEVEESKWADDEKAYGEGWYIGACSNIFHDVFSLNSKCNRNVFATEKQVKSALAMARISQLMAHDERYGGVVTDEEWKEAQAKNLNFYGIVKWNGKISDMVVTKMHLFLAFHTSEQRDLFLKENEGLIKDYLMIE